MPGMFAKKNRFSHFCLSSIFELSKASIKTKKSTYSDLKYQNPDNIFKYGPFPASFWIFISLFLVQCKIAAYKFTMFNVDRKSEQRRKSMSIML